MVTFECWTGAIGVTTLCIRENVEIGVYNHSIAFLQLSGVGDLMEV
jgi:hypothetical protein